MKQFFKTVFASTLGVLVALGIVTMGSIFFIIGVAASADGSSEYKPDKNTVFKLSLDGVLVDQAVKNPFSELMGESSNQMAVSDVIKAIRRAKANDNIKGIYLEAGSLSTGFAGIEAIRRELEDFKDSGKFIVSYGDYYTQGAYYLCSVADSVFLNPQGSVSLVGLASQGLFFTGLAEKIGVEHYIFKVGTYKSAVEPFFLKKFSDANREQLGQLVHSMWSVIAGDVAESRGLTIEMLDEYADELSAIQPEDALAKGMVDGLKYEDEMNDLFAEAGVEADGNGQYRFVLLGRYAAQVGPDVRHMGADRVAVLYADGQIVDGEGYDAVYGNTLAEKIRQLRLDDGVKAVVVRVNSPGGSALASDVIWREMELLKAEKPVIVSMGAYAASGGYYISAPADAIVADRLTLTGSIGVFGMLLDAGDAMERKLGVTVDAVKSNRSADLSIFRGLTPTERAMMLKSVDRVYETFTNLVAEGRNLPVEEVLDIAGGRVWSGVDALEIGLIDSYGGLKSAIAVAVDKAGLGEEYFIEEVREAPQGLAAILAALNAQVEAHVEHTELFDLYDEYRHVRNALSQQGVLTYCPYVFSFE